MGLPEPVLVGIGCASVQSTIQGRSLLGMAQLDFSFLCPMDTTIFGIPKASYLCIE